MPVENVSRTHQTTGFLAMFTDEGNLTTLGLVPLRNDNPWVRWLYCNRENLLGAIHLAWKRPKVITCHWAHNMSAEFELGLEIYSISKAPSQDDSRRVWYPRRKNSLGGRKLFQSNIDGLSIPCNVTSVQAKVLAYLPWLSIWPTVSSTHGAVKVDMAPFTWTCLNKAPTDCLASVATSRWTSHCLSFNKAKLSQSRS